MLKILETEHGVQFPADMQAQIEAELGMLVDTELQAIPGVQRVLQELLDQQARIAVASNSHTAYIEHALRKCGIRSARGGCRTSCIRRVRAFGWRFPCWSCTGSFPSHRRPRASWRPCRGFGPPVPRS